MRRSETVWLDVELVATPAAPGAGIVPER